ncbi:diguanylate cyclase [Paucibacter sp. JuS9]|uniref:sensor domain-containing diguanylate cyclase n=1 Tax=Roseateles TaxID=93681 RepID=UPI002FE5BE17
MRPDLRRFRIKSLVMLVFSGLALVLWLPIYVYINHGYVKQLVNDRGEAMHDLASAVAAVLGDNLHERKRELSLLAQSPYFRNAPLGARELRQHLERIQKSYPHYVWLGVVDTEGIVRSSTGDLLRGVSVRHRPWFDRGKEQTVAGDLHEAMLLAPLLGIEKDSEGAHLIDFAAPLLDEQGRLRGVLGAHADWGWATDVVKVLYPAGIARSQVEVLIVNRENRVIHPHRYNSPLQIPVTFPLDQNFAVARGQDGKDYLNSSAEVRDDEPGRSLGWRVIVQQPCERALADVAALQRAMVASILLTTLVFVGLVWWGSGRITRPLRLLASQARKIEQGEVSVPPVTEALTVEVHDLAEALRGMAGTLLDQRRDLADNNLRLERLVAERTRALEIANEELSQIARQDPLTGLPNRRAADERLRSEFVRMKRSLMGYAVLMVDIDNFKRINDRHGHAEGDRVLSGVANLLAVSLRESDFVARFGGEEFLVVLPDTDLSTATCVAEKLREAAEVAEDPHVGRVTMSIGLAMASPAHVDEREVLRLADACLYAAKASGRNSVVSDSLSAGHVGNS